VRKRPEHLREDDAEVAGALAVELAEDAVEDPAEHVEGEAEDYGFAAAVTVEKVEVLECNLGWWWSI
jgi:hypothetical protein